MNEFIRKSEEEFLVRWKLTEDYFHPEIPQFPSCVFNELDYEEFAGKGMWSFWRDSDLTEDSLSSAEDFDIEIGVGVDSRIDYVTIPRSCWGRGWHHGALVTSWGEINPFLFVFDARRKK